MITAAQDQALTTPWLGYHMSGTSTSDLCRRCQQFLEIIEHIVAGCLSLAQTIYLDRHNAVASAVHWNLCGLYGLERSSQWWYHCPEPVLVSANYEFCIILIVTLIVVLLLEGLIWCWWIRGPDVLELLTLHVSWIVV